MAAFLLVCSTLTLAAQTPLGDWDFVMKGSEHGVAQITFSGDGTLTGTAAFTFFGKRAAITNRAFVYTNIVGSATLDGSWAYDGANRITGFINEISASSATDFVTNGLSFRAVVKPTRVTMLAFGNQGRITFKGIPLEATNDISGTYHATGRQRDLPFPFVEIFEVSNVGLNDYEVIGGGPGYDYTGRFLVSRQRYAAFYQTRGLTYSNSLVTVYAGPFNASKRKGSLTGTDGIRTGIRYNLVHEAP